MRILVSNDDGIDAVGLQTLVRVLGREHEVYVSAPDRQRSAASHSATFFLQDLYAEPRRLEGAVQAYAVSGTPADCVYAGLYALADGPVDLVVSGINRGWNVSTDCHYSGTVAAAFEGLINGVPAMAVSLASFESDDYEAAAEVTALLVSTAVRHPASRDHIWNVNVPSLPMEQLKGFRETRFDVRGMYDHITSVKRLEDGRLMLHFDSSSRPGAATDDLSGDITAVENGYVSVTLLKRDWTGYELMAEAGEALQGILEKKQNNP
ncbi:MAG: 5'/3'-nucleotidase SurE [Solobacterium sp.]|nr:5'/3'-nucleotidase SurE [Solobacterium sp.]